MRLGPLGPFGLRGSWAGFEAHGRPYSLEASGIQAQIDLLGVSSLRD